MKKKILIADDNPVEMISASRLLVKNGYQIIVATDGEEAIAKIESEKPQLIILDVVMPRKNGFQVIRHLKTSLETSDIKILILSNKSQESDKIWGIRQGADEYLTKPFVPETLLKTVENLI